MLKTTIYVFLMGAFVLFSNCVGNRAGKAADQMEASLAGLNPDAKANYDYFCSSCHGAHLQAFVERDWVYGDSDASVFKAIKYGYPDNGMPAYETNFSDDEIQALVTYIKEGIKGKRKEDFIVKDMELKTFKAENFSYTLEVMTKTEDSPWGMTFLPDGQMLVAVADGTLLRVDKSKKQYTVTGVPEVVRKGQGGLMDIILHPNFEENRYLYLSYSKPSPTQGRKMTNTAVARAVYKDDVLSEVTELFVAQPYSKGGRHFGSRFAFDKEGYLYFSVGDRGNRDEYPQSLGNDCGKMHRIHDDGTIPEDNPFVNKSGASASIFSYGHRNIQGVAVNKSTNEIWTHEHGPRGGDEVNIATKALNYGWPVISYGINYIGTKFTDITHKEGMEQPLWYWVPSIAPCGMAFVDSKLYPGWEGDLMVGSLRFEYVQHCKVENNTISSETKLFEGIGRVRNVQMDREGYLYVAVEEPGIIYRVNPLW